MTEKAKQLYIHVPFCKRKCNYCDFCSFPTSNEQKAAYVKALEKEISLVGYDGRISTCFIGGGTPSLLSPKELSDVVSACRKKFDFSPEEFTVEANPESLTKDFLLAAKDAGVNRISLGVQSFSDDNLKLMGRLHDSRQAISAVKLAKSVFENVSADLILGFPNTDEKQAESSVKRLSELGVTHVSAYGLQLEEGTKLFEMVKNGLVLPDDDRISDIYDCISDTLEKFGYHRYEISNFAKSGFECKHNLGYWQQKEYVGVGLSAHGFEDGVRYFNTSDLKTYFRTLGENKLPTEGKTALSPSDAEFEAIMLALRTSDGLDARAFEDKYNCNFFEKYNIPIKKTEAFTEFSGGRFRLKKEGFYVSNQILLEFMPD